MKYSENVIRLYISRKAQLLHLCYIIISHVNVAGPSPGDHTGSLYTAFIYSADTFNFLFLFNLALFSCGHVHRPLTHYLPEGLDHWHKLNLVVFLL